LLDAAISTAASVPETDFSFGEPLSGL